MKAILAFILILSMLFVACQKAELGPGPDYQGQPVDNTVQAPVDSGDSAVQGIDTGIADVESAAASDDDEIDSAMSDVETDLENW